MSDDFFHVSIIMYPLMHLETTARWIQMSLDVKAAYSEAYQGPEVITTSPYAQ